MVRFGGINKIGVLLGMEKKLYSSEWRKKIGADVPFANSGNDKLEINYQDHPGLWKNELEQWMPENVFDAHIHLGRREFMTKDFSADRLKIALSSFGHMTIEELDDIYAELYPGKNIVGMFAFPFPFLEIDPDAANSYIIKLMKQDRRVKGFIMPHPASISDVMKTFDAAEKEGVRYSGVKPYFDLLGKCRADTKLHEILPEKLLSFMNSEELLLTLHSTDGGIGDENIINSLARIVERFPNIKIILAHMGIYLKERDFESFMKSALPDSENIFLDTSFASEKSVYDAALSHAGIRKRLLFASDNPFGLMTGGEFFTETGDAILMTRDKYTWSGDDSYGYNMTHNTYHCLKALKDAIEDIEKDLSKRKVIKNDIFMNNALSIIRDSMK